MCPEFEGRLAEAGLWVFPKVGVKYCLEALSPESVTETKRATFGTPPPYHTQMLVPGLSPFPGCCLSVLTKMGQDSLRLRDLN